MILQNEVEAGSTLREIVFRHHSTIELMVSTEGLYSPVSVGFVGFVK